MQYKIRALLILMQVVVLTVGFYLFYDKFHDHVLIWTCNHNIVPQLRDLHI
jgi:hypothetical protein